MIEERFLVSGVGVQPAMAASVQSDRGRNFVILYRLFLDCGSGF
jgi:hypothetical protein